MIIISVPASLTAYTGDAVQAGIDALRDLTIYIFCDTTAFGRLMSSTSCEAGRDPTHYIISDDGANDLLEFAQETNFYNADSMPRVSGLIKQTVVCGSEYAKNDMVEFARLIGFEDTQGVFYISAEVANEMVRGRL